MEKHDEAMSLYISTLHILSIANLMSFSNFPREMEGSTAKIYRLISEAVLSQDPESIIQMVKGNSYSKEMVRFLAAKLLELPNMEEDELTKLIIKLKSRLPSTNESYAKLYELLNRI